MKLSKEDEAVVERVAGAATAPMDAMLKRQQRLTQEMLKYSFELGQKLGYIAGWADHEAGNLYREDCTPKAFTEFLSKVQH